MAGEPGEMRVYRSRLPTLGMVAAGLGMGALGVLAIVYGRELSFKFIVVGVAMAPTGLLLVLCFSSMLFTPVLVVGREGITENVSLLAVGHLRWEEIAELRAYERHGMRYLAVIPRDLNAVLARPRVGERFARRAAEIGDFPPIEIPETELTVPLEELLEAIDRFRGGVGLVRP
jgi:hypothetical protein